jgi:type II secretory pathway pseudopilin PulG
MRFKPTTRRSPTAVKRAREAFTLVEVLAALLFMGIVIPVAMEGLRIANRAGVVGQRKAAAARIAERVLNEAIITGQMRSAAGNGVAREGAVEYPWTMRAQAWPLDTMRLLTVAVTYEVQAKKFEVSLSTLVDSASQ